jgi:hypothetical protein
VEENISEYDCKEVHGMGTQKESSGRGGQKRMGFKNGNKTKIIKIVIEKE